MSLPPFSLNDWSWLHLIWIIPAIIIFILYCAVLLITPINDACGWHAPFESEIKETYREEFISITLCEDGRNITSFRTCEEWGTLNTSKCLQYSYWEKVIS